MQQRLHYHRLEFLGISQEAYIGGMHTIYSSLLTSIEIIAIHIIEIACIFGFQTQIILIECRIFLWQIVAEEGVELGLGI